MSDPKRELEEAGVEVPTQPEILDLRAQLDVATKRLEDSNSASIKMSEAELTKSYREGVAEGERRAREKAVPEGWQLVPKTLTSEMMMASYKAAPTEQAPLGYTQFAPNARWKAMLAAAPSPASLNAKEEKCKGENCTITNGLNHSDECIAQHERCYSSNSLDTAGNRNPGA